MRRGGEEQSYLRSYLRVIFVYIGKRAEITSFTLFALPPYVGYPPLTPKLAVCTHLEFTVMYKSPVQLYTAERCTQVSTGY